MPLLRKTPLISAAAALLLGSSPLRAQVARFDATTDTIHVAGQTVLGTTATFEARLLLQPGGGGQIYMEQVSGLEDKRLVLNDTGPAGIGFTGGTNITAFFSPVAVAAGVFHHVAFVRDGSQERLYLDGGLVGSRAVSGDIDDSSQTSPAVGAQFFDQTSFLGASFIGDIDTLRISNVARYSGASYVAPTGDLGSDANTLLLYNFNAADLVAGHLTDLSGNGHSGTLGVGFVGATSPEILSSVPEPSTGLLLVVGGLAMAWRQRMALR